MTTYYYINAAETTNIADVLTATFDQMASIILGVHPNDLHKRLELDADFGGDENAALNWCFAEHSRLNKSSNYFIAKNLESLTKDLNDHIASIDE